ncbi:sporulation protein YunB [Cohnella laeviribosi]|uniref:sporulation protein YunB n=1 Tax=Cohnella laeviribosi TaxID=380174 RepID=UPI00035D4385|nr:sporulation protein YunB [Cohnella laeviribosi]
MSPRTRLASGGRFTLRPRSRGFVARASRRSGPLAPPSAPKRWTVRPRRRMKRRHFWLIMLALAVLAVFQTIALTDKLLRDPLMFLAKVRTTQMATEAINQAIKTNIASGSDGSRMIQWQTDGAGGTKGFMIDYAEQMRITAKTIQVVEEALREQSHLYAHIPIGHALNSPIISSIGPSVSVKFEPASAVQAEVRTRQTNAGINNVLVEVYIHIKTEIFVLIPFDRDSSPVETDIPLSYVMVVGDVPMYYYDGQGNPVGSSAAQAPAIALPPPPSASEGAAAGH